MNTRFSTAGIDYGARPIAPAIDRPVPRWPLNRALATIAAKPFPPRRMKQQGLATALLTRSFNAVGPELAEGRANPGFGPLGPSGIPAITKTGLIATGEGVPTLDIRALPNHRHTTEPYQETAMTASSNPTKAVRCRQPLMLALALLWQMPHSAAAAATPPAAPPAAKASIQFSQGKTPGAGLQLEVKQATLADIVKEIAAQTKIEIHYSVLPEAPVTATCVAGKVQALLECLVGKQIGVVTQKPEGASQEQVWLIGSSMNGCPAATAKAPEAPAPLAPPTPEQQAEADQAQQEHTQAMLKQAKSKNPDERFSALGNLADPGNQDPAIDQALRDALKDKDANVRSQAVASMAMRGADDMLEQLGQALHDSDAGVRMAAIGATNDNGLLQQALSDKDPAVRGLAQSRLNQLERIAARQNQ